MSISSIVQEKFYESWTILSIMNPDYATRVSSIPETMSSIRCRTSLATDNLNLVLPYSYSCFQISKKINFGH
jgi:hypothetical protein